MLNVSGSFQIGSRLVTIPGQTLFSLDEMAESAYFVVEGLVLVSQFSLQGREVITSVFFPGEVCGGFAVLTEASHGGTARVPSKSPAVVNLIRRSELMDLVRCIPTFYSRLIATQQEKERFKDQMLLGVVTDTCEQRVASSLLWMGLKTAQSLCPLQPFPLCRQEIADLVGTTVETVVRVLSSFRKRGMVCESEGHLEIDVPALMALAPDRKMSQRVLTNDLPQTEDCT
jgi:CRP/FNR family transcriptional regulator